MDAQPDIREQFQGLITLEDSMREKDYHDVFPIFSETQRAYDIYHG